MTYQTSTIPAGTRIVKGPSKIDLLEALFFDQQKILIFDTDSESVGQIVCHLHGLVKLPSRSQCFGLLISYNSPRNGSVGATMTYDWSLRDGFITATKEVIKLFELSPYNDYKT